MNVTTELLGLSGSEGRPDLVRASRRLVLLAEPKLLGLLSGGAASKRRSTPLKAVSPGVVDERFIQKVPESVSVLTRPRVSNRRY
jgi:hypothetical protein